MPARPRCAFQEQDTRRGVWGRGGGIGGVGWVLIINRGTFYQCPRCSGHMCYGRMHIFCFWYLKDPQQLGKLRFQSGI